MYNVENALPATPIVPSLHWLYVLVLLASTACYLTHVATPQPSKFDRNNSFRFSSKHDHYNWGVNRSAGPNCKVAVYAVLMAISTLITTIGGQVHQSLAGNTEDKYRQGVFKVPEQVTSRPNMHFREFSTQAGLTTVPHSTSERRSVSYTHLTLPPNREV